MTKEEKLYFDSFYKKHNRFLYKYILKLSGFRKEAAEQYFVDLFVALALEISNLQNKGDRYILAWMMVRAKKCAANVFDENGHCQAKLEVHSLPIKRYSAMNRLSIMLRYIISNITR